MRTYVIIGFAVGMFFLLISPTVIPSAYTSVALKDSIQESITSPEEIFCENTGMPDLIIEDLLILPGHFPDEEEFGVRVKNIGNVSTPTDKFIDITVIVRWKILSVLPLIPVRKFTGSSAFNLASNETKDIPFSYTDNMPILGFYTFYCKVNPEHIIDESNYQNNVKTETVLFILRRSLNYWF